MDEIKEIDSEMAATNKKELGRKFFVFLVWIFLVIAVAVLVGVGRLGEDIFAQALNSFYIISITYIGGNVAQKIGKYVSEAIGKNSEGEK